MSSQAPKPTSPTPGKPSSKLSPSGRQILKYTNLAVQMIVIIVAGSLGGKYLDAQLGLSFPAFTLTGVLLSVFAAVYLSIREFLKK